jgi:hypothetical protein
LLQLHAQLEHCRAEGREQLDELGIVMLKQLAAAAAAEADLDVANVSITQLRDRVQQLEDAAAAAASPTTSLSGMVCAQVDQKEEEAAAAAAGPSQLQQQYAALQEQYVQLAATQEAHAGYCRLLRSRHEQREQQVRCLLLLRIAHAWPGHSFNSQLPADWTVFVTAVPTMQLPELTSSCAVQQQLSCSLILQWTCLSPSVFSTPCCIAHS